MFSFLIFNILVVVVTFCFLAWGRHCVGAPPLSELAAALFSPYFLKNVKMIVHGIESQNDWVGRGL